MGDDCFICSKTLSEGEVITVKKKRIETLIKASVIRGHKEHERMLTSLSSIRVHSSCQRHYGDERAAAAVVRRSLSSDSSSSLPSLTPLPVPEEEEFDFKNACFICTENIPENVQETNQRVRLKQRIRISTVRSFSAVKKSMLSILKSRNDEVSQSVNDRIEKISRFAFAK
ncbi:unnamed protein product [Pieris macdunnoughi]|uniref:Uncharacterized protein n=1 Tax=Pieris macdunnoughi TaxID=345717 RepID=A0A821VMJ1_9NEOP|nr:unnamed protein product [Pieris macdunnoughi]